MTKRLSAILVVTFIMLSACGCITNVFKPALKIGPYVWQDGVLLQEVRADMDQCVNAAEKALEKLGYGVTKRTFKDDSAQIMSNYQDGRIIWIDIRRIDTKISKLEIRVGATGEKEPETEIYKKVIYYLRRAGR